MFTLFNGHGFQITFDNGYRLSVIFGYGSYSENKFNEDARKDTGYFGKLESRDAEIAIISPNGSFVPLNTGDQVEGWITPDTLAEVVIQVARLDPGEWNKTFYLPAH